VTLPEPTIVASHPVMVKTCASLFVRVWKNLTSLSIVLVVQLSTRHISSSIGLPPVTIYIIQKLNYKNNAKIESTYEYIDIISALLQLMATSCLYYNSFFLQK
jgi:hypothetical protein